MKNLIAHFTTESKAGLPDISHFVHNGMPPLGSNPGGVYHDPYTHEKHYVKLYDNADQARSEVAAAGIYEKLGAKTLKPKLANYKGQTAVVTKWRDDLTPVRKNDYAALTDAQKHDLANHFHAAVLTKNWDTVGLEYDNVAQDKEGKLHTLDTGGSFNFRAMGGHKPFESDIDEHQTLRDPKMNVQAHQAFRHLKGYHLTGSLGNVQALSPEDIHKTVTDAGLTSQHATTLSNRRDLLLQKGT